MAYCDLTNINSTNPVHPYCQKTINDDGTFVPIPQPSRVYLDLQTCQSKCIPCNQWTTSPETAQYKCITGSDCLDYMASQSTCSDDMTATCVKGKCKFTSL